MERISLEKKFSRKTRLSREDKKALTSTAEKFLGVMKEKVSIYLLFEDVFRQWTYETVDGRFWEYSDLKLSKKYHDKLAKLLLGLDEK